MRHDICCVARRCVGDEAPCPPTTASGPCAGDVRAGHRDGPRAQRTGLRLAPLDVQAEIEVVVRPDFP